MERFYPLHVRACTRCWLVQIPEFVPPEEVFTEYAYFSALLRLWVEHARRYVEPFGTGSDLGPAELVVELASNDGYLLQHFVRTASPCSGSSRRRTWPKAADRARGADAVDFFGARVGGQLAAARPRGSRRRQQRPGPGARPQRLRRGRCDAARARRNGDLRVPAPRAAAGGPRVRHDLPRALLVLLALRSRDLRGHGLAVFDVEELPDATAARCVSTPQRQAGATVVAVVAAMLRARTSTVFVPRDVRGFRRRGPESKWALLDLLIEPGGPESSRRLRRARKGNTLLNYCGIRTDLLDYMVDRNPYKQGHYLPGTHIPILPPDRILETPSRTWC